MTSDHQRTILAFIKRIARRLRLATLLERALMAMTVLLVALLLGAGLAPLAFSLSPLILAVLALFFFESTCLSRTLLALPTVGFFLVLDSLCILLLALDVKLDQGSIFLAECGDPSLGASNIDIVDEVESLEEPGQR